MTVEDDRPTYERLVREKPDFHQKWKIDIRLLAYYLPVLSVDYILIRLYINSLSVTLTSYLEHGIE
jgi:hypothetical protein